MRFFLFFLVASLTGGLSLLGQSSFEDFYLKKAQEKMDAGSIEAALEDYKILVDKYPSNADYQYNVALCQHRLRNYEQVIAIMEPLSGKNPDQVNFYRLLGNAYDLNGNYKKAVETFERGMKMLPYDGEFYHDMGIIEMIRGDYDKAVGYWEGGVSREPYFADNYYWLCKTYAESGELELALIYGEYFMVLDMNSEKFNETGKRMYDIYISLIKGEEIPITRQLQPQCPNAFKQAFRKTFEVMRENGLLNLERVSRNSNKEVSDLSAIGLIRADFIELWMQMYDEEIPVLLYQWHNEMNKLGKFHFYNYWVFVQGDPAFFTQWLELYKEEYKDFINWFIYNRLSVDILHFFDKRKFDE